MRIIFYVIIFFSFNAQALTLSDIDNDRGKYADQKIEIQGIISNLKYVKKKYDEFYQFTLKDKFNKEYIKVKYYLILHDEKINKTFGCHEGQAINLSGNLYAKPKGKNLGELLVQDTINHICKDDDSFKSVKISYTLSSLNSVRNLTNKKMIKISGFIKRLRINLSAKKTTAHFNLVEQGNKLNIKITILLKVRDEKPINDFHCKEGQSVTLTGPYLYNKKSKTNLGSINIISSESINCGQANMSLSQKDKILAVKELTRQKKQRLNILFSKYKKYYKSKKDKFVAEDFNNVYEEMKKICKDGINNPKISMKCVVISYYARTIEQRNQLSFRINSAKNKIADWKQLYSYQVTKKNSVLEIIKALYPNNSDYIIGIPKRCYPDQQFNPSASNFPYRKLGVSKYAKDNFTAILHRFNDPALKCGSLLDSIFMIGNMDSDNNLEVIKINLSSKSLIKVIKSDI